MIIGVGIDLCSVARMRRELDKSDDFVSSVFTLTELAVGFRDPHPARRFAALFSAKEAVVKAMAKAEPAGALWHDIEVGATEGTAHVRLLGRAREIAASLGIEHVRVAFTNTEEQAMACAFATSSGP